MYRERRSRIDGAVVWTHPAAPGAGRILPDGCIDLIAAGDELVVAGPDTAAFLSERDVDRTGLRFAPGTAPAILGVPAHELRNRRIPLDALWPAGDARRAAATVRTASSVGAGLEALAAARLAEAGAPPAGLATTVRSLAAGREIAAVASMLGITARQLHRRSLDVFGYGPKLLTRVLRMQRALGLARAGTPLAATAARAGYADQAHLARDVRALAGVPLGELTGQDGRGA
jgi:AraC-like DNA-binding protein